jgi:hypothetical protein
MIFETCLVQACIVDTHSPLIIFLRYIQGLGLLTSLDAKPP